MSDLDLANLAFAFGQYLNGLPGDHAYASEACKFVYQQGPDAQDLLKRYGKLKGLVPKFPYTHNHVWRRKWRNLSDET